MRVYLQPALLIWVAVLAIGAGATRQFEVKKKEHLPLKKSLEMLDENGLASYRVEPDDKLKIENEEIIKALGTEDYIQWVLEDTDAAANSTVRECLLFITYYGSPDRVPHVPEECYTGGGFQRLASDSVTFEIDEPGFEKNIRGKYLVFGSTKSSLWRRNEKFPVLYLFKVNGEYAGSRDEARIALNKALFRKHSYFCKVELVFNKSYAAPSKEEAVAAGEKLLAVILPVLEREHWPDWEK